MFSSAVPQCIARSTVVVAESNLNPQWNYVQQTIVLLRGHNIFMELSKSIKSMADSAHHQKQQKRTRNSNIQPINFDSRDDLYSDCKMKNGRPARQINSQLDHGDKGGGVQPICTMHAGAISKNFRE